MHLAVCAIFRNEAPYLREWIAFHHLAGVDRFHLYQNRSEDDYESVLRPFIDQGLVRIIDWPTHPPSQLEAYQHFINENSGKPWWVAFLDCDEFLFSPSHEKIGEAIEAIARPDWGAIGVNWMCFGSSGQDAPASGLVTERFSLRPTDSFAPNRHIKSIVRMDKVAGTGSNPHWFRTNGGTFSESGGELTGPHSPRPAHSFLRINHYHTKSRQEYMLRIARGNADGAPRRSPSEFDLYQATDIDDRVIWRFLPALRERMERDHPPEGAPGSRAAASYAPFVLPPDIEPRELPRDFASFRGYHQAETMLVCGCGASLSRVVAPERFVSIGVNDVGRLFQPDYLVVVNPRSQFSGDRFRYVETSRASAIFTQLDLGVPHPNIVRFQLGKRGGTDLSGSQGLPYTRNSPYVALCLAISMGAARIGLIGVDFTEHHFFAATGRHPLASELSQINKEYEALAEECRKRGVQVFNLSAESRLTAFTKISPEQFARSSMVPASAAISGRKIFFVNYRFLSCGEVFSDGLRNAGEDLSAETAAAYWDDPALASRIDEFAPDLLFVVHGRNYSKRFSSDPQRHRAAVWLLDEPYEVDDTSRFAQRFGTVFVNDPSTLSRHKNAHYLPVCYDPTLHHYRPGPREHRVGFIGGANPVREKMLAELARRNLLSYAIGGPWRAPEVRRVNRSQNIPAAETASLYQQTKIVLNVFRAQHHFNREHIGAISMNPRIYEALACGALVVSERRPEIQQLCPELPVFDGADEMVSMIEDLLSDPARFESIRRACIRRLAGHTYAHRLHTAFLAATGEQSEFRWVASAAVQMPAITRAEQPFAVPPEKGVSVLPGWEAEPQSVETDVEAFVLRPRQAAAPGSETGLIGTEMYSDVRLAFDVYAEHGTTFVAKIHQREQRNQSSNSYHLMVTGASGYIARHDHPFGSLTLNVNSWNSVILMWRNGTLSLRVNGKLECAIQDSLLSSGYCFVGAKTGSVRVRSLEVSAPEPDEPIVEVPVPTAPGYDLLYDSGPAAAEPVVSIVTTVYDRVSCLDACLRSVGGLKFDAYEHIVVADGPSAPVLSQIRSVIEEHADGRHPLRLASLRSRSNNWGIAPASLGLSLSSGKYVCFLSDDNGYKPEHFDSLLAALEADPGLGFVYSGCLYDGRLTLNFAPPAFGRIDLGQPLFRRELFDRYFGGTLPFKDLAWDWRLIERLLANRVRWKHISNPTFIFRLAKYPQLAPPKRPNSSRNGSGRSNGAIINRRESGPEPEQRSVALPFTATPRRNLIYHLWPVRGSTWRWNIELLKQRLDLFNGRRIVSIVHDRRSDDPEVVQAALEGHGCEFLVCPNHPSGEAATFPEMLRRIASTDVNEVTFYAHGKGVKHEPAVPAAIRRWAEVSYRAALDDWFQVRAQLEQFALTGSFRRFGRFEAHRNLSVWHYHGTFFWMRHAHVFARDCFHVPRFYCGVEAWPGIHFAREEGGCLLLDALEQPASEEEFWKEHEADLARWESAQVLSHSAPDLSHTVAFDGCDQPRLHQRPDEFAWFLARLSEAEPRTLLAIGERCEGAAWHIARRFRSMERDIEITVVHPAPPASLVESLEDAGHRFGQVVRLINADPASPEARARVSGRYDAVLLEGECGYREGRRRFDLALSTGPRLIGISDIADSDWHAQRRCGMPRLWMELRPSYVSEARTTGEWGGIGVLSIEGVELGHLST